MGESCMSSLVVLEQLQISDHRKNGDLMVGSDVYLKIIETFTRGFGLSIRKKNNNWKLFIVNTLDLYRQNIHEVQL